MVSFIVISGDSNEGIAYINQQCDLLHISNFDRILLSKETLEKETTQSLGIAEIKTLQKKIYLKPIQGSDKAVIIHDAMLLTHEAQNALLKVLEEPPHHTYIYILAESLRTFLPTILSRCQVIQLEQSKKISQETIKNIQIFLDELPSMTVSKKLQVAEIYGKQKKVAVEWLENVLMITRTILNVAVSENKKSQVLFYLGFIKQVIQTTNTIQSTNVNVRLALEHMLLKS